MEPKRAAQQGLLGSLQAGADKPASPAAPSGPWALLRALQAGSDKPTSAAAPSLAPAVTASLFAQPVLPQSRQGAAAQQPVKPIPASAWSKLPPQLRLSLANAALASAQANAELAAAQLSSAAATLPTRPTVTTSVSDPQVRAAWPASMTTQEEAAAATAAGVNTAAATRAASSPPNAGKSGWKAAAAARANAATSGKATAGAEGSPSSSSRAAVAGSTSAAAAVPPAALALQVQLQPSTLLLAQLQVQPGLPGQSRSWALVTAPAPATTSATAPAGSQQQGAGAATVAAAAAVVAAGAAVAGQAQAMPQVQAAPMQPLQHSGAMTATTTTTTTTTTAAAAAAATTGAALSGGLGAAGALTPTQQSAVLLQALLKHQEQARLQQEQHLQQLQQLNHQLLQARQQQLQLLLQQKQKQEQEQQQQQLQQLNHQLQQARQQQLQLLLEQKQEQEQERQQQQLRQVQQLREWALAAAAGDASAAQQNAAAQLLAGAQPGGGQPPERVAAASGLGALQRQVPALLLLAPALAPAPAPAAAPAAATKPDAAVLSSALATAQALPAGHPLRELLATLTPTQSAALQAALQTQQQQGRMPATALGTLPPQRAQAQQQVIVAKRPASGQASPGERKKKAPRVAPPVPSGAGGQPVPVQKEAYSRLARMLPSDPRKPLGSEAAGSSSRPLGSSSRPLGSSIRSGNAAADDQAAAAAPSRQGPLVKLAQGARTGPRVYVPPTLAGPKTGGPALLPQNRPLMPLNPIPTSPTTPTSPTSPVDDDMRAAAEMLGSLQQAPPVPATSKVQDDAGAVQGGRAVGEEEAPAVAAAAAVTTRGDSGGQAEASPAQHEEAKERPVGQRTSGRSHRPPRFMRTDYVEDRREAMLLVQQGLWQPPSIDGTSGGRPRGRRKKYLATGGRPARVLPLADAPGVAQQTYGFSATQQAQGFVPSPRPLMGPDFGLQMRVGARGGGLGRGLSRGAGRARGSGRGGGRLGAAAGRGTYFVGGSGAQAAAALSPMRWVPSAVQLPSLPPSPPLPPPSQLLLHPAHAARIRQEFSQMTAAWAAAPRGMRTATYTAARQPYRGPLFAPEPRLEPGPDASWQLPVLDVWPGAAAALAQHHGLQGRQGAAGLGEAVAVQRSAASVARSVAAIMRSDMAGRRGGGRLGSRGGGLGRRGGRLGRPRGSGAGRSFVPGRMAQLSGMLPAHPPGFTSPLLSALKTAPPAFAGRAPLQPIYKSAALACPSRVAPEKMSRHRFQGGQEGGLAAGPADADHHDQSFFSELLPLAATPHTALPPWLRGPAPEGKAEGKGAPAPPAPPPLPGFRACVSTPHGMFQGLLRPVDERGRVVAAPKAAKPPSGEALALERVRSHKRKLLPQAEPPLPPPRTKPPLPPRAKPSPPEKPPLLPPRAEPLLLERPEPAAKKQRLSAEPGPAAKKQRLRAEPAPWQHFVATTPPVSPAPVAGGGAPPLPALRPAAASPPASRLPVLNGQRLGQTPIMTGLATLAAGQNTTGGTQPAAAGSPRPFISWQQLALLAAAGNAPSDDTYHP